MNRKNCICDHLSRSSITILFSFNGQRRITHSSVIIAWVFESGRQLFSLAKRMQQWILALSFFLSLSLLAFSSHFQMNIKSSSSMFSVTFIFLPLRLIRSRLYVLIVAQRVWIIVSDSMTMVKTLNGFLTSIFSNLIIWSTFVAKRTFFLGDFNAIETDANIVSFDR